MHENTISLAGLIFGAKIQVVVMTTVFGGQNLLNYKMNLFRTDLPFNYFLGDVLTRRLVRFKRRTTALPKLNQFINYNYILIHFVWANSYNRGKAFCIGKAIKFNSIKFDVPA